VGSFFRSRQAERQTSKIRRSHDARFSFSRQYATDRRRLGIARRIRGCSVDGQAALNFNGSHHKFYTPRFPLPESTVLISRGGGYRYRYTFWYYHRLIARPSRQPYSEAAMKPKSIFTAGFAALCLTVSASGGTVPLDVTGNYNFPLDEGGGGAVATLNGATVEIFCDDYENDINLSTDYTANVTQLSTTANLSKTRFGGVSGSGWTQFTTLGTQDDTFFNSGTGSSALARYAMVAYLSSLYNLSSTDYPIDNEIQDAIWTIMDPAGEAISDPGVNGTSYIEQAATWYMGMDTSGNLAALNTFLSYFDIVSDSTMTFSNGLGIGGFQEQIIDPVPVQAPTPIPTPEPRGIVLMLFGLFAVGAVVLSKARGVNCPVRVN
jgi:hypothetical protein